jgi:transcriptional regulator with XRE-family HTH domain
VRAALTLGGIVRARGDPIMVGMAHVQAHVESRPSIGPLLQYWRRARNLSQLALAHEANVSPRHVCFLETGRAKPSREMVLLLADTLAVPLRERNALLLAAGFAPMFCESTLDDPELAPVRAAIHAILKQQEPYPAVVMNRHSPILACRRAGGHPASVSVRPWFQWFRSAFDTADGLFISSLRSRCWARHRT